MEWGGWGGRRATRARDVISGHLATSFGFANAVVISARSRTWNKRPRSASEHVQFASAMICACYWSPPNLASCSRFLSSAHFTPPVQNTFLYVRTPLLNPSPSKPSPSKPPRMSLELHAIFLSLFVASFLLASSLSTTSFYFLILHATGLRHRLRFGLRLGLRHVPTPFECYTMLHKIESGYLPTTDHNNDSSNSLSSRNLPFISLHALQVQCHTNTSAHVLTC